jgi:hypothetical protein
MYSTMTFLLRMRNAWSFRSLYLGWRLLDILRSVINHICRDNECIEHSDIFICASHQPYVLIDRPRELRFEGKLGPRASSCRKLWPTAMPRKWQISIRNTRLPTFRLNCRQPRTKPATTPLQPSPSSRQAQHMRLTPVGLFPAYPQ